MVNKLLLLTRENEVYRDLLIKRNLPDLVILGDSPSSITEANIWLAEPALAAPLLNHARHLRWLQSTFAGVDKLMAPRQRQDYQLTNVRGIFGPLMSEYLFGYLLAHNRQHQHYQQLQQQRLWQPGNYRTLQGQQLLLLGTGSIAVHLATTAKHFGMKVIGINRKGQAVTGFDLVDKIDNLSQYLPEADVIASVLPNTPATQNILNRQSLALLKSDAVLFNLGRGNVLDLDALAAQLALKPHQQAILDVFNQEPLPSEHPIWLSTNAIITPHVAAPSFPIQTADVFCNNYALWLNEQPLNFCVDFENGY